MVLYRKAIDSTVQPFDPDAPNFILQKKAKKINETLTNETVKLFVSFARFVVILD